MLFSPPLRASRDGALTAAPVIPESVYYDGEEEAAGGIQRAGDHGP
jgi:hypothetical protein